MNLLPKDGHFSELLQGQLAVLCEASSEFESGLKENALKQRFPRLSALEKEGDRLLRETMSYLQQTFLTPFEPEQVQKLARKLDDVIDAIEEATFRIVTYHVEPVPAEMIEIGQIVRESCQCLRTGMESVIHGASAISECQFVGALESRTDSLSRQLLSDLFAGPCDAFRVVQKKEVIEALEQITDRCEDVADALEEISQQWCKNRTH
jgi:uncharacterized protein Yka (UPF0111/DUF47 family)